MPAAGPQNTRKRQLKRKPKPKLVPHGPGGQRLRPAPKPKAPPTARQRAISQERSYKSQGRAVEKAANQGRKNQRIKRKTEAIHGDHPQTNADRARNKPSVDRAVSTSRLKYLRRTRKPVTTLKKELEGKGLLAAGLKKVGESAGYVSTGGGPNIGTGLGRKARGGSFAPRGSAAITAPRLVSAKDSKGFGRFAKDLVNFPAQAIPSVYVPAAGLAEAAQGRPKRIKKFAKDLKETDPIYNTAAAVVEKVKGNDKAAASHLKKAGKSASEHPGFTALELYGAKGTVGRAVGRVDKPGVRPSAKLEGTPTEDPRAYSKDVFTRDVQKATDKAKTKHATRLRAKADRTESPDDVHALRRKANRVDPTKMNAAQVRRRVDERVAANEDVRRINRSEVTHAVEEAVKPAKKGGAALSLVSQRIAKADKGDLKAYRDEVASHFDELSNAGKRANRELTRAIDKVIKDPKADMDQIHLAARKYEQITAPIQKKLSDRGMLAEGQADKAKLIPYAVRHMGAKHDGDKVVVSRQVKRAGVATKTEDVVLKPEVIRAHMRKNGVEEPAFLTQAPNMRGAKNFYKASDKAPSLRQARRTGQATRQGTFDVHPETLKENAARAQGLADAADGFTGFVHEFAHRQNGKVRAFKTYKDADNATREVQADSKGRPTGDLELRPVRLNPWGGSNEQLHRLLDEVDSDSPTAHKTVADAIEKAMTDSEGEGPWALVPKAAADQMAKHMRVVGVGALGKSAQLVNSTFRKTVLSTSPKWLLGNVSEAALRSALAKAGPRSYATGRKVVGRLREIDPDAAKEASVRTAGGGHFSMADKAPHRDHTQFDGERIEPFARKMGAFARAPGPKQASQLWHGWTNLVFHTINRRIETQFQTAMLGKAIRDSHLMDGQTLKLSKTAVEQAAQGLRNTNEQVAFGRAVDRMYGKYNKFSPEGRQALALYTPFVAWTLNAVKFVADVLPRDHPTVTALLASTEIATEEWRKAHGLDLFIDNRVPSFLQGSIPLSGGRKLRVSSYTPFGAFGSVGETAAGAVLPQLSGVLAALKSGEDWKGSKLRVDGKEANELQRWGFAAQYFMEATVPVLSLGKRIAQDGPSTLNPVRPVKPQKKKIRRTKNSGGFSSHLDSPSASGFKSSGSTSAGFQSGG